jgi:hypothetical protein
LKKLRFIIQARDARVDGIVVEPASRTACPKVAHAAPGWTASALEFCRAQTDRSGRLSCCRLLVAPLDSESRANSRGAASKWWRLRSVRDRAIEERATGMKPDRRSGLSFLGVHGLALTGKPGSGRVFPPWLSFLRPLRTVSTLWWRRSRVDCSRRAHFGCTRFLSRLDGQVAQTVP